MVLGVGEKLGPYEILARIGAGGMGEVWKARDTRLNRAVAIKVSTERFSERFEREAKVIAALNHPNICTLYDVGPNYLVMEYIDGAPLRSGVPAEEALRLAIQITNALEEAHGAGILHRDLKPSNVLVTGKGVVKLLDFGLAKLMTGANAETTVTLEGMVAGTAAYMSPEQAQGKALDERSEIFSFGAVLYEMLSGIRAFGGSSSVEVLSAIMRDEPRPLRTQPDISRIVMRCLRKAPSERFQSIAEVKAALVSVSTGPAEQQPSVAVLPFSNMSADKENEYFSDGLAEEVINALAQIPGLSVTARTSSFAFRGKEQDIRKIAEILDVRTVLEGSVRRAGNRIRVTAQLINAANGYHLWSERYDRELADVFAIQDEIAQAIAGALKVKLAGQFTARRHHTPVVSAYEAFLKARHFLAQGTPQSTFRAKESLDQAIALDPEFALAQADRSMCFVALAAQGRLPAREALPQARAAAEQALRIDSSLPEARAGLANVAAFLDHDWNEAGRQFHAAMARDPIPASVNHFYGFFYLLPLGRAQEAAEALERALTDDPLNVLCTTQLAVCYWTLGRHEDAFKRFRQALELNEHFPLALMVQSIWHSQQGRLQEALSFAERAHVVAPENASSIGTLAGMLWRTGDISRAERLIRELGDGVAYGAAMGFYIYNLLKHDMGKAAEWAAKAIDQRDPNTLPGICGPNRKILQASGQWPALAGMLNLPGAVTAISGRSPSG